MSKLDMIRPEFDDVKIIFRNHNAIFGPISKAKRESLINKENILKNRISKCYFDFRLSFVAFRSKEVVFCGFSVTCFWCRFALRVFILILVRFRLPSGHLFGNSCSLGLPYVIFVF